MSLKTLINNVLTAREEFRKIPFNKTIGKAYMVKKNALIDAVKEARKAIKEVDAEQKKVEFSEMKIEQKNEFYNLLF
jgi:antitoxin component of RelBE/YafQ-DinJ toxin-antitoxin module